MTSYTVDCRSLDIRQTGLAILAAYNAEKNGGKFSALVDCMDASLRIWLIEAGAKHQVHEEEPGVFRLTLQRGLSPGQGTIPGLHHLALGAADKIWACERSKRLIKVDACTGQVEQIAEIAKKASHLAPDNTGQWVFVADPGANSLLAVSAADLSVQHAWRAPGGPQLPLVTDEGIVCVTGGGSGTLTIVRPGQNGYAVQTLEVGACPHDPLVTPDGRRVFVPCAGDGTLVSVDLEDGRILARFRAGDGASHVALHPDGDKLYCANTFDGTLSCLSVEGDLLAQQASGPWAHQAAISPDGCTVFVANFLDDSVSVFSAASLERLAKLETEPYPHGLEISPDGKWLVATGFSSDKLRIYDVHTRSEVAKIEVGRGSSHIAFLADQQTAYVACSVDDHLARLNLETMTCTQHVSIS